MSPTAFFSMRLCVFCHFNIQGLLVVREHVAEFIRKRDGMGNIDPNCIFLTGTSLLRVSCMAFCRFAQLPLFCRSDGASPAIQCILNTVIRSPNDGIMLPIPQVRLSCFRRFETNVSYSASVFSILFIVQVWLCMAAKRFRTIWMKRIIGKCTLTSWKCCIAKQRCVLSRRALVALISLNIFCVLFQSLCV